MDSWKPKEAARLLGIQEPTLRQWVTKDDIGQYLSASGQGGDGRHRSYNEQDIRILVLVRDLRHTNTPLDEIHANLRRSRSAGWDNLPEIPPTPPGIEPVSMVPTEAANARIGELRGLVSKLETRIIELEEKLGSEVERRETVQNELQQTKIELALAKGQLQENSKIREERDRLQEQFNAAQMAMGEKTGQLSERQSAQFWLERIRWLIIAVVILGAALVAALVLLAQR